MAKQKVIEINCDLCGNELTEVANVNSLKGWGLLTVNGMEYDIGPVCLKKRVKVWMEKENKKKVVKK